MDDVDLRRELREEGRLLHRRVAAADDGDLALAEEEAVAGRAVRDAAAGEPVLAGDADLAVRRAGREDDGLGLVDGAAAERHALDRSVQVELDDVVVEHLGAEALGLLLHLGHEVGALDAFGEAGEVLHIGRVHQLAARLDRARDDERRRGSRGRRRSPPCSLPDPTR